MLRIRSIELSQGKHRYCETSTDSGSQVGHYHIRSMVIPDAVITEQSLEHSPCDVLYQGDAFDKFNNKDVLNRQFMGTVSPTPSFDGVVVGETSSIEATAYDGCWCSIDSLPPAYGVRQSDGSIAASALLDVCPFSGRIGGESTSVYQIVVFRAQRIGTEKYKSILHCHISISTRKGTTSGGSVSGVVSGGGTLGCFSRSSGYAVGKAIQQWKADVAAALQPKINPGRSVDFLAGECNQWINNLVHRLKEALEIDIAQWQSSIDRMISSYYRTKEFPEATYDPLFMEDLWIWEKFFRDLSSSVKWTEKELSIHAREVVESYNEFDSNLIAYAADLKKTGDTVRSLLQLGRNPTNPKAWASAWLSGRYGDRLAISDTEELFKSLQRRLGTRLNYAIARKRITKHVDADKVSIDVLRTSTLIATNKSYNELMTAVNNLMRWDAWPTLENTWDLVPLSFVVDWFLPVQDLLGQIDAAVQAPYIRPISSYIGEQRVISRPIQSVKMTGVLKLKTYVRTPHSILSDIRPFDVDITPPSFSVVNVGDALALLVQTSKRA